MRFVDQFKAILFDMNGTFMFGEDRLGADQDFYQTYRRLGGRTLSSIAVQKTVLSICERLGLDYDNPALFDSFPSLADAVRRYGGVLSEDAIHIENVIAAHEVGQVPNWAAATLKSLARTHDVGVVTNVWARAHHWNDELGRTGITESCRCMVFSSELGSIKPSQVPFLSALRALAQEPQEVLFVGDSLERDIRPARALRMATVRVGRNGGREEADFRVDTIADLESFIA